MICLFALTTVNAAWAQNATITMLEAKANDGTTIQYLFVTPPGFKTTQKYTSVIVLPPGREDEAMARQALTLYFEAEVNRRGWVVACPISPQGSKFFAGRPDAIWAVADDILNRCTVKDHKHHLAGVSNGGIDALSAAALSPARFSSVTVLPGMVAKEITDNEIKALASMPVRLVVGGDDSDFMPGVMKSVERLTAAKARVSLTIIPNCPHIVNLGPTEVGDLIAGSSMTSTETVAPGAPTAVPPPNGPTRQAKIIEINRILDDFHLAASRADFNGYFDHFAPDGVFYGTDATERWTVDMFRAYAGPKFAEGKGWTYIPSARHIFLSAAGDTAWFDEMVTNEKYFECRGTGVLVSIGGTWKVSQYNLVIPVPNDKAPDVVKWNREQREELRAPGK
jgi:pimeloyl-ACP methyl ester carboxylesterase/ketosteroid isomerase-like protein